MTSNLIKLYIDNFNDMNYGTKKEMFTQIFSDVFNTRFIQYDRNINIIYEYEIYYSIYVDAFETNKLKSFDFGIAAFETNLVSNKLESFGFGIDSRDFKPESIQTEQKCNSIGFTMLKQPISSETSKLDVGCYDFNEFTNCFKIYNEHETMLYHPMNARYNNFISKEMYDEICNKINKIKN